MSFLDHRVKEFCITWETVLKDERTLKYSITENHSAVCFSLSLFLKIYFIVPWLVWLSGLSMGLQTEGSLVRLPVGAHAWVAGQDPSWGRVRGNQL